MTEMNINGANIFCFYYFIKKCESSLSCEVLGFSFSLLPAAEIGDNFCDFNGDCRTSVLHLLGIVLGSEQVELK